MHPLLMTEFAQAHSVALHQDATNRRRFARAHSRRGFALRFPRRRARLATV